MAKLVLLTWAHYGSYNNCNEYSFISS